MNTESFRAFVQGKGGMTDQEFDYCISHFQQNSLRKKDYFLIAGEVCKQIGYVNKGCLRYYYSDGKGLEHIIYFAFEDWWIGDLASFFSRKPSSYNLQALEDCELLSISYTDFTKLAEELPKFNSLYNEKTRTAYLNSIERLKNERSESAEEKYIRLIQRSPEVLKRVPLHYIASYLGIKPESLSRLRKKISEGK